MEMISTEERDNAFRILRKIQATAQLQYHELMGLHRAITLLERDTEDTDWQRPYEEYCDEKKHD
jgi:hypothetical protein